MQSAAGGGSDTLQVVVRRTLGANDTLRGGAKDNAVMVGVQSVATVTSLTSQVATEATLEITQLGDTSEDVAAALCSADCQPFLARVATIGARTALVAVGVSDPLESVVSTRCAMLLP